MTGLRPSPMATTTVPATLVVSVVLALACGRSPRVNLHQLDDSIRRELPTGTPRSAVVAFLDTHAVHHWTQRDKPSALLGLVTEVHRWGWGPCGDVDGHLTFEFDEADHLTAYEMRQVPICL